MEAKKGRPPKAEKAIKYFLYLHPDIAAKVEHIKQELYLRSDSAAISYILTKSLIEHDTEKR